ncbi:hypothetical protein K2173_012703 [Erythroxylum novogranatense]|uniref:Uncharacterized protein n=1 Tax=Erythroxylum novogranatense TaxID=1862640 RepID=A0AAV8TVI8_9ROSI|nr:hypothetical protein K2173_010119 [Erythroxylum novogranatense]KAJ8770261.1 hypothetical protein K2173_012703 [Erythroxylum novogranatense]
MYPPKPNQPSNNSFSGPTASPPPSPPFTATTGFPVTSSTQYYEYDRHRPPPHALRLEPKKTVRWSSGLFDCFSDWRNCCITCWCPCITFGQIAELVDKGSSACGVNGALYALITCVICCPCFYSCFYRSKMRQQFLLQKKPCGDCLVHCFCECCALCQEYRELKTRGFDLTLGWHGNVEKTNRSTEMSSVPPTVESGMSR